MVLGTTPTQRQLLSEQGYNNLFGLTLGQPGYWYSPNIHVHTPIFSSENILANFLNILSNKQTEKGSFK